MTRAYEASCPKCGSTATKLRYCNLGPGMALVSLQHGFYPDDHCQGNDPEHFHRNCETCGYRWVTHDVIGPQDEIPMPWTDMVVIGMAVRWWCGICRAEMRHNETDAQAVFQEINDHLEACLKR